MLVSVCKIPYKQTLNWVAVSAVNGLVLKQSCKKSGLMTKVSLFFWTLGPDLGRLRNVSLHQRKMMILSYKSLVWTYFMWKGFFLYYLLSFKLPIISYIPALIYPTGLFEPREAEAPILPSQRSRSLGSSALGPFRRQSFFDRVNQSLERDRLAIESALRVQRPHSTSSAWARRSTNLLHLLKDKSITVSTHPNEFLAIRIGWFVYVKWEYTLIWSFSKVFTEKKYIYIYIYMHM